MNTPARATVVCTLYKFVALQDFAGLRAPIEEKLRDLEMYGTLLLAHEGINGTVAGSRTSMDRFLPWLDRQPGLCGIEVKRAYAERPPFRRIKVKLKKEIVTMGVEGLDPLKSAGTYVAPEQWNELIDDPEVLLVDVRNRYEIKVGQFRNAVNPRIASFREFPAYAEANLDPDRHKKVAMYCTGGIRCEKSTALLRERGFEEVYHLKGGILKYLETVPRSHSLWEGECFVFDERVTVNHDLESGSYDQCHACRCPITAEDRRSEKYVSGVSCPACFDRRTGQDRKRYAEREKQVLLAAQRGGTHIGSRK
ncbi:MAG: rhodanese-related sulfurtransferase [Gammaproteobacteria bacterium]|nr:rhodanese-related sulfurtransferase [Gammaproteobacteria bacterium]